MQAIVGIFISMMHFSFSLKTKRFCFSFLLYQKMTVCSNSLSASFTAPLFLFLSQSLQTLEQIVLEIFKTFNTDAHS